VQISYNDIIIDVKSKTKVIDILKNEIDNFETPVIACKFNNEIKSLNYEIGSSGNLELVDLTKKDGMRVYKRGLVYIICKAIRELYPHALLTIEYQLYHGMYCRVENAVVTDEMIKELNKKVSEIIKKDLPITKKIMTKEEATEFYEKEKTLKGKLQLDLKTKKEVTLYYCEDYYNYFYGVLPIATGVIDKYEILKYEDGILIRYPGESSPNEIKPFKDERKMFETLEEYSDVHRFLKVDTLYKLNKIIENKKIKEYILLDEALHEKKIAQIAEEIKNRKGIKLITIAGPSSSGKTTFAKRLSLQLKLVGIKPVTISVDNYFVERRDTPKDVKGEYDFEALDAVDRKLLNNDIIKLLNGEEIDAPIFDFIEGKKIFGKNKLKLEDDEILIMEGIHCLNDELTYLIPKDQKFKIYISALTVLNIDYYNRISTTDTRLLRRMVRDYYKRGASAEHTLKMWPSVNRGEKRNIFKFQEQADIMFNSSLIYELAVLKEYAVPLLKQIDKKSEFYSEAKRILSILNYFNSIPNKDVPSNSLLREFIGNSIFEE